MGGGTQVVANREKLVNGLSPRGRGNHIDNLEGRQYERSIPAWAGEPTTCGCSQHSKTVYPRVGGGTAPYVKVALAELGLSPRGRGNPFLEALKQCPIGSIPAWAGEPWDFSTTMRSMGVYPRVGGGTG